MYTVKLDGQILFDPRVDELKIYNPKFLPEVNTTFGFDFIIYPNHPLYAQIKRFKSVVEVFQGNTRLFRGRILNDEIGFLNEKKIICEGDLAFFNDSIIRPYEYAGDIIGFLRFVIDEHNKQADPEKRFTLGEVTVTNSTNYITRSSINPAKSWDVLMDKLVKLLGGFIVLRREGDVNYIDYLADSKYRSLQEIELGKNLLDLTRRIKGENIITALIPYGARLKDEEGEETDERVTIEAVNGGVDYVFDQEAVDLYGWVFGTETWDDVTIDTNLLRKAKEVLAQRINMDVAIELTAVDLSMMDASIDEFRIFEYVKVNSPSHLLDDFMLVSKMTIDLLNPQNNTLTLGLDYATFTERQLETEQAIKNVSVIKGPKGERGPEGPQGATGSQGPRGNTGTSVESITEYYLATSISSGILSTNAGFTTTMQAMTPTNKYLWNYEKVNFSDGTSQPTIPVIIGVHGDKGQTGSTGATGRSIVSITEHYLATSASTGVTRSTAGWNTTMQPTTETNRYLWNYETITWSAAPLTTYVEPIIIGVHGAKGPQGIQGPKGSDGQTTYTWVKYADTKTGVGMSDSPDGKRFIGLAFNKTTQTESTTPSDYQWSELPQNIEVGGRNLFPKSGNFESKPSSFWVNNGGGLTFDDSITYNGYGTIKTTLGNGITGAWLKLENGVEYTYSVLMRSEIPFEGSRSVPVHYHAGRNSVHQGKIMIVDYMTSYTSQDVGKFKKLWITFKLTSDADSFRPFLWQGVGGVVNIAYLKLEKGNIATDWTPAPEDMASNDYVTEHVTTLDSNIEQTAEAIRTGVERDYTAKSEFETYQKSVTTQFEQTAESFNFTFSELIQQISTLDGDTKAQFEEIVKYIRFVNGNIVLGQVGNEITLEIKHDRISFLQSGAEVAYFSNNKLYVVDGEFLNSLQIGTFAFIPRANGSLDFK